MSRFVGDLVWWFVCYCCLLLLIVWFIDAFCLVLEIVNTKWPITYPGNPLRRQMRF